MSKDLQIVLIEDDELVIQAFVALSQGLTIHKYNNLHDFLALSSDLRPSGTSLFFVDLCSPQDPEGLLTAGRISELKRLYPDAEIIVESGLSDPILMRKCIGNGASRFILKEFLAEELLHILERHSIEQKLKQQIDREILGFSPVVKTLKAELLRMLGAPNMDVLIDGETGTGKELCARALRADPARPFVAVNVAAIPKELFESEFFGNTRGAFSGASHSKMGLLEKAADGILFLDEIQSLDLFHQGKLLRVLETRKFRKIGATDEQSFRARVVSATNQRLPELVAKGLFREDLYYRLSMLKVNVPPLRMRGEDISLLAKIFLEETTKTKRFDLGALDVLVREYDWPGNVRELRGFVRELAIKSPIPIFDADLVRETLNTQEATGSALIGLPKVENDLKVFELDSTKGFDANVALFEKYMLEQSLSQSSTAVTREKLRMSRSRFYEKLKIYGLLKAIKEAPAMMGTNQ